MLLRERLAVLGNRVNLSAAGFAEGQVNAGTISDPIAV